MKAVLCSAVFLLDSRPSATIRWSCARIPSRTVFASLPGPDMSSCSIRTRRSWRWNTDTNPSLRSSSTPVFSNFLHLKLFYRFLCSLLLCMSCRVDQQRVWHCVDSELRPFLRACASLYDFLAASTAETFLHINRPAAPAYQENWMYHYQPTIFIEGLGFVESLFEIITPNMEVWSNFIS